MPRRSAARGWGSSGEEDDDDGGDFNPSRQATKRRKTHADDDGSGYRPSLESQITESHFAGDHGGDYGATGDGMDSNEVEGNADGGASGARRGRPPGRRTHQATEESMELAPYMLSERRSTRAVVAAIQEALEPRISAAARDCALYNAKIVAERNRVGPVYWDSNTQTLQAIYAIRAPKFAPEEQIVPAGAEISAASRSAAAGKRQNPEQLYRELMDEIVDAKGDFAFNRYAEWKDKFASSWTEPVDVTGNYIAPMEPTVQSSLPRFTSTRAAAAAALASFQAPGGILSSLTPAPNKIAARTIQAISRIAQGGGRGRKKRGGDSEDEDDDDISDDDDELEEIEDDDGAGSGDSGEAGEAPAPATPAPRKPATPKTPKSTSKAAAFDPAILCANCQEATAEETLSCSQCRSLHHPSCLQLQVRTIARAQAYPWRCNDCKLCETCAATGDEEKLLMCDACDRGYHSYCLNPPLDALPEGEWLCDICKADGIVPSTEPQPIAQPQPFVPKKRGRPPKSAAATPRAPATTTSSSGRKRKRTNMDDFDELDDDDDLDEPAEDDDGEYR
eukprot:TRINITY_DN3628_c0_g1_i1.p1 TRINITY_DN3628_c0_g1~~TRINITY_DN3628_c0_g1_i1.p1  ORF type:complete len:563 (+),score=158.48 TRINITY_DN3628_c0_g1_i1:46-1734(+)